MKAFSFLTILESLSKKLSILRTKMHSDDLRVDYESITSQLRVNPLFSRTSLSASSGVSLGTSFGTSRRASHFAAILTILFTIGVGNVWGADFTPQQIKDGTTSNKIKVSSKGLDIANKKLCSTITSESALESKTSSNENYDNYYVEIQATEGYVETLSLKIRGNSDGEATIAVVFWNGDAEASFDSYLTPKYINRTTTDCDAKLTITVPNNTKTVRVYRRFYKSKSSNTFSKEDKSDIGSGSTFNVFGITATSTLSVPSHSVTVSTEDANKGTASAASTIVAEGGTTTVTATPKSEYVFSHWTVSGAGSSLSSTTTNPTTLTMGTADATVTAYFAQACNESIYNLVDGVGSAQKTADKATVTAKTSLVLSDTDGRIKLTPKSGYKFKNGDVITFSGTISNNSKKYGIKVYASDGSTSAGEFYTAGNSDPLQASGTLNLSSDQDYIYIARYDGTTTTLTSCVITQKVACAPASYSVTYDANGATSGSVPTDDEDYESGATVTVKSNTGSLAKTGYTFDGWNTNADGTGTNYTAGTGTFTISANTTLYAKWNINSYTLTWNVNGGNALTGTYTSGNVNYGAAITKPTNPTRTGHTFAGWSPEVAATMPAANTTYTAQWTAKTTNVTLNANGGTGGTESVTATYGSAMTTITPATLAGYALTGYFDATSGGTKYYNADGTSAKNWDKEAPTTTLYAQWTCETPVFDIKIKDDNPVVFSGESIELTVVGSNIAANATYQWYKKNGATYDELAGETANKLTIAEATANDAGNYKCVVTNATCSAENNYTVKMYHIKGLTDGTWTTPFEFVKSGDKEGTFSVELAANTTYYFKLNDGSVWYWNEGTMTHNNCTDWVIEQEGADTQGKENTGITTTASDTYIFTLNYEDPSKPKLSVTYPQKKMVYFNPNIWDADGTTEVYTVYSWQEGSNGSFVTMTSVEGCGNTNIYQAEIDALHNKLLFIRWNQAHTAWDNNRWNQSIDLDYQTNGQYKIDDFGNNSDLYWKDGAKKSWASHEKTFTPNYTVTFDANGHGTAPADQCIAEGGKVTTPTAPTATGYTFGGWYKEAGCTNAWDFAADVVTSDITLYAKWTAKTSTITWNANGGSVTPPTSTYTYDGATVTLPTPTRDGYTFNGWFTAASGGTKITEVGTTNKPSADVEYFAQWTINSYTVSFDLQGHGSAIDNQTINHGGQATTPTEPTATGYTFGGWYKEPGCTNAWDFAADVVTSNITLYAKWTANTYTLTYNINRPTKYDNKETETDFPAQTTVTVNAGGTITLPNPSIKIETITVYTAKWKDASDKEYTGGAEITPTGDMTLTAQWTPQSWKIGYYESFDGANLGTEITGLTPNQYTYGVETEFCTDAETIVQKANKTGYTWLGWWSRWSPDAPDPITAATPGYSGEFSLFAKWEENTPVTPPTQGGEVTAMWPMVVNDAVSLVGNATHASITLSNASENGSLITIEGTQTANYTNYAKKMAIVKVSSDSHLNENNTSINEDNYIKYTLTVAQGYTFTPTGFSAKIGKHGTDNGCAQVVLKNGSTTLANTEITAPSRTGEEDPITNYTATINNAAAYAESETIDLYVYFGGKMKEKAFLISEVNILGTWALASTPDPEPDDCGISECGNATLTYAINASTSTTNTADNLLSSATASNTTALGINATSVWSNITASGDGRAAEANACFNPAPVMSSKISMPGERNSYKADNYIQFTFTVKDGYAFTPCDIQFVVQPVNSNANFRWAITDGATEYGSGTATNVPLGLGNGATVLTGITSPAKMIAGTYYIRLYPYDDNFKDYADSYSNNSFRISNDVILKGTVEEVVCTTPDAPTAFAVGSITSNGATFTITDAANTNNYEIYYSTTSTAPTAETEATITTTEKTKAVTELTAETTYYAWVRAVCNEENKSSWVALTNNSFTTSAELTPGDCEDLVNTSAKTSTELNTTIGNATLSNPGTCNSSAIKLNSSGYIELSPKTGYSFEEGDKLFVTIYNQASKNKTTGFKIGTNEYTVEINRESNYTFEQTLTAANIIDGKVKIMRHSSDGWFVSIIIQRCAALPSCTTPVLSNLENQKVCPGSDVTWTASNTATPAEGETIAYQWNKKGNNTVLSNIATLTLDNVTEAAGGTYVVTATVSAEGKASATATKEVTLTVTPATATPTIKASANTIYTGNSVTLTASCASSGVTYKWYTCTDAEGNGESAIGDATNATTLTAGEAGTHYYKVIVTGDGTNSCGTAEKVYTLIVSAAIDASDCTTYFWFPYAQDATENGVTNNENKFFGNSPKTGQNNAGTYKFKLDDITYTATRNTADANFTISFTIPDNSIGTMAINCKGSSSNPLYLKHTDGTQMLVSDKSSYNSFVIENITSGEWKLQSAANWTLSGMAVKVCSGSTCTDPQVTATVNNATICEGTENVTFTATNYANGAKFQWQKKDGNTWKDISGATSDTYTIPSVATAHAGQYRVIAQNICNRISEEVTLTVLTAPTFNTFATTASVMKGNALAISDVQATNATGYAWYKSTDNSFNAAEDTKVSTSKDLLLAAASITEAADQTFYLFCVASNSCGSVTSNAITVTVTPFVAEECATAGNETNDHEFDFTNTGCSEATLDAKKVWSANTNSKYLTYTAKNGRYFKTAKVQVAHSSKTIAAYAYITDETDWTAVELTDLTTSLTTKEIIFPENVTGFRIGRKFDDKGEGSGNFYLYEACFTYENACTETTLTPDQETKTYNITDGGDFTKPTFTLKAGETTLEGQTLTYTSSNPAIATVDEEGNVEFEGMTGTITITATFAGGKISETEYCACQGSYTITVVCNDEAPKIIAADEPNLGGCYTSVTLEAKMQDGTTAFADGTFQWYRNGVAIDGATNASYEVVRAGTYTVSRTDACIKMSSNSAVVTNENVEPEVERLTPFQYYHVDKTYSNQMKNRHLFAVTSYGTLNDKRYHLTATRNGDPLDLSSSTAFFTIPSSDNAVDTVMIDLNELKGKYSAKDEIVITCAPINSCNAASAITASITIHVIDQTPTLALICSGANGDGTRDTKELVVGGDFLTGYNKADLCQQTSNTTFDPNTEWGFYTELKKNYIVVPVNGYAEFNKLNYEPFDILLLTDYPKSSKNEAAQKVIDDMAELCDYRPLLSFKTHFQSDKWKDANGQYKYTKWVKKGFTTAPVVPAQTATYVNIVCYAHPMFDDIDEGDTGEHSNYTFHDADDPNQLVYHMLSEGGYESVKDVKKGIQGFELAAADNFVTIGLVHYNATANKITHTEGDETHTHVKWTAGDEDRLLVAMAERQTNIEARMMLFSLNAGAQSLQTEGGRLVILKCLEYLLQTDPLQVADCRFTFDNGEGAQGSEKWENGEKPHDYQGTGYQGDGLWSTAANWGPDYNVVPGRNNDVRIAAPCIVDGVKTKLSTGVGDEVQESILYYPEVLSIHITKDGSLTIPANSSLTARSTILRADENGNVYPTNVEDISLGSNADGNASLILNNERGDTKAEVAMYSKAKADTDTYSEAASTWQYIGTPHSDVQNAVTNYYNSWLYQYDTENQGWAVIQNGGPLDPFRGYCITHPEQGHTYWMEGTLAATTNQDITIPAGKFVVVANSWTAPIQIHELTDDDMEGLTEKTIYFFNTGSDPNGSGELNKENGRYAAGTYVSVPIHSAPYTGDSYIPSMQGFYVVGDEEADGTLHLDYERHVRAPRTNTPSGPMHAPARRIAADNEPQVAKFLFRGTRYDDRLIILERPDFTRGYDSGWDGEQWGGNAAAPMSYVVAETRWDAVSAIPEYEGTIIGFRAGEDSEYTIHFDYDGMEDALYLLDTDTQIYTRVLKGNSYTFTCADKAEHNRFILTRKAPQIATGTDHINTGENAKAVKFIKDDKIFIFVNGMLYDATGKIVIR